MKVERQADIKGEVGLMATSVQPERGGSYKDFFIHSSFSLEE